MSSLLSRFRTDSVGSVGKIKDYVQNIGSRGDFEKIYELNAILNSWNNILLTPKRTYPNNPLYGSDLYKMVFEPLDDDTAERIKDEIYRSITLYDDRASIEQIDVYYLPQGKGFSVDIFVNYKDVEDNLTLVITEQAFSGFLTVED